MVNVVDMAPPQASLAHLLTKIQPYQEKVLQHSLYAQLNSTSAIRYFMSTHIFAVWDNMLLLKTLQQRLTCVTTPWLPPADVTAARLINEIILDEETEEVAPGQYLSHVEFYLNAMEALGADTQPIKRVFSALRQHQMLEEILTTTHHTGEGALGDGENSLAIQGFVRQTWNICQSSTAAIVASLLLGREEILSPLFNGLLEQIQHFELSDQHRCIPLKSYCERHLSADESRHIPMARDLLIRICGNSPLAWAQAKEAATTTLVARERLWDSLSNELSKKGRKHDLITERRFHH